MTIHIVKWYVAALLMFISKSTLAMALPNECEWNAKLISSGATVVSILGRSSETNALIANEWSRIFHQTPTMIKYNPDTKSLGGGISYAATCDSSSRTLLLELPRLDKPRCNSQDLQSVAFAVAVSDVVVYVAEDAVFTPDIEYIGSITAESDTSPADAPSPLKTLVVVLNTVRDLASDNGKVWSSITDIPRREHTQGDTTRWPVSYRFETDVSSVTPTYVQNLMLKHNANMRTGQQVQRDIQQARVRVFGTAGAVDHAVSDSSARWEAPSLLQRIAEAKTDISQVLLTIDQSLLEWYMPAPSNLTSSSSGAHNVVSANTYKRQRFDEVCAALTAQINATLADTPALQAQALQRVQLHRDRFDLLTTLNNNQVHDRRESLTNAAVMVYASYAIQPRSAHGASQLSNCTSDGAVSALSCALALVKTYAGSDISLRSAVVDDLLFTDDIFQQYELHRDVKDAVVGGSLQIHFFNTLSMLLDAGYTPQAATQLVVEEIDRMRKMREEAGGALADIDDLKAAFLESARHFNARPPPVRNIDFYRHPPKSRNRLVRSIVGAVVGVTIAVFMPAAAGAILPSLGTLGTAVLTGATAATASAAINKDPKLWQAAARGALLAGAANVIGGALPFETSVSSASASAGTAAGAAKEAAFSLSNAALRVGAEAAAGCAAYELTGGKCKHGLIHGAVGEVTASTRVLMGIESKVLSSMLAGSASATTAWATGGSWEEAFLQGVFIDQFNHAMHGLQQAIAADPPPLPPPDEPLALELDILTAEGAEQAVSMLGSLIDDTLVIKQGDHYVVIAGKYGTAAALGTFDVAWDLVKGTATLIRHPIDTASAIKDFVSAPDLSGRLKQAAGERVDTIKDYKQSTTSPGAFRDYVKSVVSTALDCVAVVNLPAAGASAAKATVSGVAKVGAATASAAKKATSATIATAEKVGARAADALESAIMRVGTETFGMEALPKGVSKATLGAAAENNAAAMARFFGETVHPVQTASGHGIDLFTSKLNPYSGALEIKFMEVKATAADLASARPAYLSKTNHGQQMSTQWLCKKFDHIYKTDPQLVRDVLHSMETSHGNVVPSRVLYRPTADNNYHFENHRLPAFDSVEFHRHLKSLIP